MHSAVMPVPLMHVFYMHVALRVALMHGVLSHRPKGVSKVQFDWLSHLDM